jgi:hypothetical protein
MDKSRLHISFATVLLCGFLLFSNIAAGIYFGTHYPHDAAMRTYLLFDRMVIWLLIGLWVTSDSKRFEISWLNRIGSLVYLIGPVVIPFYLWQTRHFKGIIPVVAFAGIVVVATAVGGLVYTLFIF